MLGEANFSDHGANRLGASALMQGLADGYFVIPYTIGRLPGPHAGRRRRSADDPDHGGLQARPSDGWASVLDKLLSINGERKSVDSSFHRARPLMWDNCGMSRTRRASRRPRRDPGAA